MREKLEKLERDFYSTPINKRIKKSSGHKLKTKFEKIEREINFLERQIGDNS